MTAKIEGVHSAELLLSEGNGQISREEVTISSGAGVIRPGTLLTAANAPVTVGTGGTIGTAVKIAYGYADATDADAKVAVIARQAEVNGNDLNWPTGADSSAKAAAAANLATVGIIVR